MATNFKKCHHLFTFLFLLAAGGFPFTSGKRGVSTSMMASFDFSIDEKACGMDNFLSLIRALDLREMKKNINGVENSGGGILTGIELFGVSV